MTCSHTTDISQLMRDSDGSFSGFFVQLLITIIACTLLLVLFEVLRRSKRFQYILRPKQTTPNAIEHFDWIKEAISTDDSQGNLGPDMLVYLLFIKRAFWTTLIGSAVGIMLMFVNAAGSTENSQIGLDRYSIANVKEDSNLFWFHVTLAYVMVLTFGYFLYKCYYDVVQIRLKYIQENDAIHTRTVYVTGIPQELREKQRLWTFFESLGLGEIKDVRVVPDMTRDRIPWTMEGLKDLIDQRKALIEQLEVKLIQIVQSILKKKHSLSLSISRENIGNVQMETLAVPELSTTKEERVRKGWNFVLENIGAFEQTSPTFPFKTFCKPQDSTTQLISKIHDLTEKISRLRQTNSYVPSSTGFITYATANAAHLCAQIVIHSHPRTLLTSMALEPRDILWRNISIPRTQRFFRQLFVSFANIFLTFFWLVPVGFVVSLASIESLVNVWPQLAEFICSNQRLANLFQKVVPAYIIAIIMGILPLVLRYLGRLESNYAKSIFERQVLSRFFFFQIFNVLFVFVLSNTVLSSWIKYVTKPDKLVDLIAEELSKTSSFYINYITVKLIALFIEFSQLFPVFYSFIYRAHSPRQSQLLRKMQVPDYVYIYSETMLVFVVTTTFALISPIILFVAPVYFGMALLIRRYTFVHIYSTNYESGGSTFWEFIFKRVIIGLEISLVTLTGYLSIKQAIMCALATLPLIFLVGWGYVKCQRMYHELLYHFPMSLHARSNASNGENVIKAVNVLQGGVELPTGTQEGNVTFVEQLDRNKEMYIPSALSKPLLNDLILPLNPFKPTQVANVITIQLFPSKTLHIITLPFEQVFKKVKELFES